MSTAAQKKANRKNGMRGGRPMTLGAATAKTQSRVASGDIAEQRGLARLAYEKARAIRESARAERECGRLCERAEVLAWTNATAAMIRASLERAPSYLGNGLNPDTRALCAEALRLTVARVLVDLASAMMRAPGGV